MWNYSRSGVSAAALSLYASLAQAQDIAAETNPGRWYPVKDGRVDKFDDLPPAYRYNVDIIDPPLNMKQGQSPGWTDANIDDVIAFLKTLEDRDVTEGGALTDNFPRIENAAW